MDNKLPKLIVILGPTASGKTGTSLKLAKKYNGEIISADSRQVYKKMNIGTAKAKGEWEWGFNWNGPRKTYFVEDIPHHLIDIVDPGKQFTAADFRDKAIKYAKMAERAGRIPMVVGGTGLYISALVDNLSIPRVLANKKLRESLEEKTNEELIALLENLDPKILETIDKKNKRRLIRALEVCIFTGEPFSKQRKKGEQIFDVLQIGIEVDRDELHKRISERTDQMVKDGLLDELNALLKQKYGWQLPSMSGIGYKQFKPYTNGECTLEEAIENLKKDTKRFAKRQLTWFKRDKRIKWCKSYEEVDLLVKTFLES